MWYMPVVETGFVPDWLISTVLRVRLTLTLKQRYGARLEDRVAEKQALLAKLRQSPIAIRTSDPNWQHYEVPTDFFQLILGKWFKYSC